MASVRKRPWTHNGEEKETWICDYKDENGRRRQRTFKLKKEADRFRVKIEGELAAGRHIANSDKVTVAEMAELFIRHSEDRYNDGRISYACYLAIKGALTHSILPLGGHFLMASLTFLQLDEIYRGMVRVRKLQPDTAKERIKVLSSVEDYANKRGILNTRAVMNYVRELRDVRRTRITKFTPAQIKSLLEALETRPRYGTERARMIRSLYVHLAAFCGLRLGEISALRPGDFDFDNGTIRVARSFTRHVPEGPGMLKDPKTQAGIRDVPLPDAVAAMVRRWIADFWTESELGLLIHTEAGYPIDYRNFRQQVWLPSLRMAGLLLPTSKEVLHFHALRHFAASNMIANKLPVSDVSALIGHANISTTVNTYVKHLGDASQHREAMNRMVAAATA